MRYLLFTYPSCPRCDELKKTLEETDLEGEEYNLSQKESKLRIREFLGVIRRDDKRGIIIPTLVLQKEKEVVAVLNTPKELEDWLRSKD